MSKIEWTDATWNPVTGCTKISPGCQNCYAERMARRLAGRHGYPEAPNHFDVTLHPDRLNQPLHWKKPRMVFVCSMSDLFHEDVPEQHASQVFGVIGKTRHHMYQILTKRPAHMKSLMGWASFWQNDWPWPHVWFGVTAENQEVADERIPILLQTPAAVRFVSVEPMLGPVQLKANDLWKWGNELTAPGVPRGLSWVIIGCESGPNRRPMKIAWAMDLVQQCRAAGVAVFVKQLDIDGRVSKDPSEWSAELRVREYPGVKRVQGT